MRVFSEVMLPYSIQWTYNLILLLFTMLLLPELRRENWKTSQIITILSAIEIAEKNTKAQVHLSVLWVVWMEASQNLANDFRWILEELWVANSYVSVEDDPNSRFCTVFEVHVLIKLQSDQVSGLLNWDSHS